MEALRTSVVDDVHLSHTIARLLELLTTNIRTRFLRFAPLEHRQCCKGDGVSTGLGLNLTLRTQAQTQAEAHEAGLGRQDGEAGQWSSSTVEDNNDESSNNNNNNNMKDDNDNDNDDNNNNDNDSTKNMPQTTQSSLSYVDRDTTDPLPKIPAQPINSSNINVSFMPPPPSVYYNYYDSPSSRDNDGTLHSQSQQHQEQSSYDNHTGAGGTSGTGPTPGPGPAGPGLPDWIALPLDQFFNSSTAPVVDQGLGGTGPMVGEYDMLEILLNEQYNGNSDGGAGTTGHNTNAAASASASVGAAAAAGAGAGTGRIGGWEY